jgi:hypothetical protein
MGWDADAFGPAVSRVEVELYTSGNRVSGHMLTRFRRVADILNLTGSTHLVVEDATVTEYADPAGRAHSGGAVMVAVSEVMFGISSGVDDRSDQDLVVQKRPVQIQVAMPPFWLGGTIHVPYGSAAVDVLNVADPFLPLTNVTVGATAHPAFDGEAPILAVQRALAEVLIVTDEAGPDARPTGSLEFPTESAGGWEPPGEPGPA